MSQRTGQDEPLEMGGLILRPGARIGNYLYMREIGSGGMARVLLAKAPDGQLMALKVLRRNRFETGLARFRREFRALTRVNHPNVIRVDSYGDLHGHPYIAMEFVDGPDLHALIRSFRTWDPEARWRRCEEILVDLCRALAAIHRRGLVHRDLKPSNVLVTREGVCKLTDFGIVKDLDPSHDPHLSTTLVGTWAYASPEQITGSPLDHRSDLYSLGVILFAMLTGRRPFVAHDMAGYLALHRDRPAPAPRDVQRDVPEHLDEICRRLLQKSPRDRYQSAQEILYRLEAEERPPAPRVRGDWEPPLVGRDLELEALGNAVAALTDGRGGVVVLEGDDGSGRTRLLDVAVDRARALGIPWQRDEFRPDAPVFHTLLRVVRDLARELGPAATRILADLEAVDASEPSRGDDRAMLQDAAREAFAAALAEGPRLLVLDDLHLAHPRELHLLGWLVRQFVARDRLALLVVTAVRPKANLLADAFASGDELGFEPQEITVGPLSREDLATIVFQLVGDSEGARRLAQRLHRETEGNASFVIEFVRALMAKKVLAPRGPGWVLTIDPEEIATGHLEIPLGVRQMMRARLEAVLPEDRRVLEVLAVGGREVDLEVLLEVLDTDEERVLDSLDRLLAAGIVRERRTGGAVLHSVTHTKFSDVVYRDLDAERRAELHRRTASALELHYASAPAALEIVGEHYRRAGDAGRAYRYLVAAARRLSERSLAQEAWDLTEKAGTLEDSASTDLPPDEFRALRRDNLAVRAGVHYNRAEWADAEKTWRAVVALAEEDAQPLAACQARLWLAIVLRRRGRNEESARFAEQALEASRRLHYREGVTDALHCMAALAWSEGRLEECEQLASEGLVVAQGSALAERRAELLLALTAAQATRGHLASAIRGLTEAEGIFREIRKKRPRCLALANLAELLTWQGEPVQARQRAHAAVELARELEYRLGHTAALRASSLAALDLGLYDEARRGLREALDLAREIELPEEVLASLAGLARLHLELGELAAAREAASTGLDVAARRDPERYAPLLRAQLATTGGLGAEELAHTASTELASLPLPRRCQTQLALAHAWRALGEPERALSHARAVLQVAGSRGLGLISLEARAIAAHLSTGDDQRTHRSVGQDLAREFRDGLTVDMARSFARRPFLKYLDDLRGDAP